MRRAIQILRSLCSDSTHSQLSRRPLVLEALEERAQPAASIPTLGTAGQFAVLGLRGTDVFDDEVTVTGDEGVSRGGFILNQRHSMINGNVQEYGKNEYGGRGGLSGSVNVNPTLLTQADADAATASDAAAALAPTQTFKSINKATTIQGNGGLNVININGDIHESLTLSGGPNDVFIINVKGDLSLDHKDSLALSGGVTANDVLFNFVGRHGNISVHSGAVVNGTLLAPRYNVELGGTVNGEVIAGGEVIEMHHNAVVNQVSFNGAGSNTVIGLAGFVFNDLNGNGTMDSGEPGMAGVVVTLTGTAADGTTVSLVATTDVNGFYSFTGLSAGTYSLQRTPPASFFNGGGTVGTVNGVQDGTIQSDGTIGQISYQAGGVGGGYNFAELPVPLD